MEKKNHITGIEKVKYFSLFLSFTEDTMHMYPSWETYYKAIYLHSNKDDWKKVLKGCTIRINIFLIVQQWLKQDENIDLKTICQYSDEVGECRF